MKNWEIALTILAAIFIGVLIPAIVQFQGTMRSLQRVIRTNEGDLRKTVAELQAMITHFNRAGGMIASNRKHIDAFFGALAAMTGSVQKIHGALRVASLLGAALAPVAASAIRTLREAPEGTGTEEPSGNDVTRADGALSASDGASIEEEKNETE